MLSAAERIEELPTAVLTSMPTLCKIKFRMWYAIFDCITLVLSRLSRQFTLTTPR